MYRLKNPEGTLEDKKKRQHHGIHIEVITTNSNGAFHIYLFLEHAATKIELLSAGYP